MHDSEFYRDQAAKYRAQAAKWRRARKPDKETECHELAEACDQVAGDIEDRLLAG